MALACLVGTLASGCGSVSTLGLSGLSIPDNDPAFRSRIYAGGSLGGSRLDPDTRGTVFNVEDDQASATQLRLGVDLHELLAIELESAVLGAAGLREAGTEVEYSAASLSALVYGLGGVQMRSRREGVSAYARVGFGLLSRSSAVVPLDDGSSGVVLGLGAEFGFENGLGLRAELTRYDDDALFAGLGAVYRFGVGPGQAIDRMVRSVAAVPDDEPTKGAPPALGAALPMPVGGGALRAIADADGDGVGDAQDLCIDTGRAISVGRDGCGLFDAVLGDVVFKSGSWWLNAGARGALDELAEKLLAFPEIRIDVQGHTDSEGDAELNLALSGRRAEAVVAHLRSRGVSERQLQSSGMGETRPLASNDSAAGRRSNRRIELVTLADLPADVLAGRVPSGRGWPDSPARAGEALLSLGRAAPAYVAASVLVNKVAADGAPAAKSPDEAAPVLKAAMRSAAPSTAPLPAPGHVIGARLNGVVDGLSFDSGSDRLSPGSDAAIEGLAERLRRHPGARVAIMAHTDGTGQPADNQVLSEARARRVIDALSNLGIEPSRLTAEGYGDSLPRVQNLTAADRARNRRVETRVLR